MHIKKGNIFIYFILIIFTINLFSLNCNAAEIYINARAAIAMDSTTKTVLYEKNAEELIPMASTTKIMTALVAINYGNLDKKITISQKATAIRGSTVGYRIGESITVKELLYGLMFRSGNDAALALAEGIGGDVDGFLKLMNEYAVEIGALNSHFESPHGLDSSGHYCTAYDLAIITSKAKENKLFNEIVGSKAVDGKVMNFTRSYNNINKILFQIPEANGVKTGYTGGAGKCLVSSVNIAGHDVIYVVLNCPGRWNETAKMHKYVLKNFTFKKLFSKDEIVKEVKINRNTLKLLSPKDIEVPVKNDTEYTTKVVGVNALEQVILKGQNIGKLEVYEGNKVIYSQLLIAGNDVKKASFFSRLFGN